MRKALMTNPLNNEKVAMSEYKIEVYHKGRSKVTLSTNNYTYEDAFEYIKEQYEHELDFIEKITIEVIR
jgi:hypothetical protein